MKKYDLIIVGGSASGLTAAVKAKKFHKDLSVAVIEKLPRVGKKILSTGNGRCNLTNLGACSHNYRNKEFAEFALNKYNPEKVLDFFKDFGLLTVTDREGRVYPMSNTASSVLDALRYGAISSGVDIITEEAVNKIKKISYGFCVNDTYQCEKIILCTGGKSSPSQGSDGSGYHLAKSLGHSVTNLFPSLVPLTVKSDTFRSLKGIRAPICELKIEDFKTRGEILFTEYGISGIAAMELAGTAERLLYDLERPILQIDFMPDYSDDDVACILEDTVTKRNGQPMENLLTGIFPKQLGVFILKNSEVYSGDAVISQMSENMISQVTKKIKQFEVTVTGTKGFVNSQVTSGGIPVCEIEKSSMKSKITDNLYFGGEIIDVDGGCGGFNLQWAFASGLLAGELN